MRFLYLRDPLFCVVFVAYFVNRWGLKPLFAGSFCHAHFNDLICIPFWVPIMLYGLRRTGLRKHDAPPLTQEVLIPLILWSLVFEVILPETAFFRRYATPDHLDILWYAVGAWIAVTFWDYWYRDPTSFRTSRSGCAQPDLRMVDPIQERFR